MSDREEADQEDHQSEEDSSHQSSVQSTTEAGLILRTGAVEDPGRAPVWWEDDGVVSDGGKMLIMEMVETGLVYDDSVAAPDLHPHLATLLRSWHWHTDTALNYGLRTAAWL